MTIRVIEELNSVTNETTYFAEEQQPNGIWLYVNGSMTNESIEKSAELANAEITRRIAEESKTIVSITEVVIEGE